ncbi:hypothetical protein Tco_0152846 [Tanacetum coccineum]
MFKLDLEHLAPRGIFEQAKAKQPSDDALDFACKHGQRIQELLVYVRDTCPNVNKLSEKRLLSHPKTLSRKLGFEVFSTSNCESSLQAIKKNVWIRENKWNMKNKQKPTLEVNKRSVLKPIQDVDVKHSLLNANFEPICATCKKSMFDGVYGYPDCSLDPWLHSMTPTTLSSGLVPNLPPSAPFVPSSRKEWDLMFKLMFDEFHYPPANVSSPVPVVEAPAHVESTGSPSSTIVDQDAPSLRTSPTTPQSQLSHPA